MRRRRPIMKFYREIFTSCCFLSISVYEYSLLCYVSCFVGRTSRYICVIKTNLLQYLFSVYFFILHLHTLDIFVTHHQALYCIYTTIGTCCAFQLTVCWSAGRSANRQTTEKHNTYHLLYIYSIPPDNGLQICPKYVDVEWRNKLRINSASSWFLLHRSLLCCYLRWQTSSVSPSLSYTHTHTHTHQRNIRCFRFINLVTNTAETCRGWSTK
jgi:hypothetical protein